MKLLYVTVPLGALMAGAGIWLLTYPTSANTPPPTSGTQPRHPVTAEMAKNAASFAKKMAPDFSLSDPAGKAWTLKELTADKPLYVYFIKDSCPCSTDAEPLFHLLYDRYKDQVNFVGIIGSDAKTAARWKKDHQMPYTILADPQFKAIHGFKATNSVFNALVNTDGTIEKMWPGYSHDMLIEVNQRIAGVLGIPAKPFDPLYAPLKLSSGCFFPAEPEAK